MKITAILPVSRTKYLDRVLESLKTQNFQKLIVVYDGPEGEYLEVRKKLAQFDCVFLSSNNLSPAHAIPERRKHIVNIHNQIRDLITDEGWVFSVEDDGVLPEDALERLLNVAQSRNAGMVTGVELGRWGVPYVGAWTVDDVNQPRLLVSAEDRANEEIDACGLYCALIRADLYKQHRFTAENGLGPDVNLGLFIRQQGFKNYIDWNVNVTHLTDNRGKEIEIPATSKSQKVTLRHLSGSTWQSSSLT